MIADLLTKLEDEKEQWIDEAIDQFHERFMGVGSQKDETGVGTAESQMLKIKSFEQGICKQRSLDLKVMETELETLAEGLAEDQRTLANLEAALIGLEKELTSYEAAEIALDLIQLEKFQCLLENKFTFDKKEQVVFKERKTSKLLEIYQMVEMEMSDFYQKQLSSIWVLLSRSMQNIEPDAKFDFKMDPPMVTVALKHGRGLDQYIKSGNFEEDYQIVFDTLVRNNDMVYDYFVSQVDQFKQNSREEMRQLQTVKDDHKRIAEETILELKEKKKQKQARMAELQGKLSVAKSEWEQGMERLKFLDDRLKEKFVKTVSVWQNQLFAENVSDEERWVYHQYCQIILKQAERIMGNDYF